MKLYCLGPDESFSSKAAATIKRSLGHDLLLTLCTTVERAVRAVRDDRYDAIAIVPYYNFLEGLVQEHLDLIYEYGTRIIGLTRVPVQFAAGGFATSQGVQQSVLSHPKALAQVSEFLAKQYPDAVLTSVSSTAEAAKAVGERGTGIAIASAEALQQSNVPILSLDVGNRRQGHANFTDFFLITNSDTLTFAEFEPATHTLIAVSPQHNTVGLLSKLLGQFSFYELDIAKIHSRPALEVLDGRGQPQMFYLELITSPHAEPFHRCVEAIRYMYNSPSPSPSTEMLRVLGAYRACLD